MIAQYDNDRLTSDMITIDWQYDDHHRLTSDENAIYVMTMTIDSQVIAQYDNDRLTSHEDNDDAIWCYDRFTNDSAIW